MNKARFAAYEILNRIERDGAYSNLLLKEYLSRSEMDSRDAAFVSALVAGVLERLYTLDYILGLYLTQPLRKLKPQVLTILRLGAYQILFMDKIPVSAAVNESVDISKKTGCAFASGLINAVLRKVAAGGLSYPEAAENKLEYYRVRYSFPPELIRMFIDTYGRENAVGIMENSLSRQKLYGRVNTLKCDFASLSGTLSAHDAGARECDFPEGAFELFGIFDISGLDAFRNGLFFIQDLSSQLCCAAVGPKPGDTVIDVCAAPGGKSFSLGIMMENKGRIISCDTYEHKLRLIEEGRGRLGIDIIETCLRDASREDSPLPLADHVLCDVPCSGFGVIGRKIEIKYKSMEEIAALPDLQLSILNNSSRYVKKGGRLTYSTCTLNPRENGGVVEKFLLDNKNFSELYVLLGFVARRTDVKALTILPHENYSDGFFIAQFERTR